MSPTNNDCQPNKSRPYSSPPDIYTVTVTNPNQTPQANANNVLVELPVPCDFIMLASGGFGQSSQTVALYFSFVPQAVHNETPIVPLGTETWIPIREEYVVTTAIRNGWFIKLRKPIKRFYLTMGQGTFGGGTLMQYTFLATNDIDTLSFPDRIPAGTN